MGIADKERKGICEAIYGQTGVKRKWILGSNIPDKEHGKTNSKATEIKITLSLFADDTVIVFESRELKERVQIVKDVMESFEERNNEAKQERAVFGTSEAREIRMLDCWLVHKQDKKLEWYGQNVKSIKEEQATKKNARTNYRNWHFVESGIFDCVRLCNTAMVLRLDKKPTILDR